MAVSVNWPDCITTDRSKTADILYPTSKLPLSLAKRIAAEVVVAEKGRSRYDILCAQYRWDGQYGTMVAKSILD